MLFTIKRTLTLPQLHINNKLITQTNQIKFLGVTNDDSLTFKYHINNLTLKISRHIALLYQIKDLMPQDVLKTIYYAHIYPLLTYCNPIWCTTYPTYLIPLKLQLKKIVRIITNSNYLEHTNPLFRSTKILKLEDITKVAIANFMYANKNTIQNLLSSHDHNTRHRDNLTLPLHRLTKFQHSISYLGPVVWNSIPPEIQDASSISTFTNRLKNNILTTH